MKSFYGLAEGSRVVTSVNEPKYYTELPTNQWSEARKNNLIELRDLTVGGVYEGVQVFCLGNQSKSSIICMSGSSTSYSQLLIVVRTAVM
jgi:hypothetical protein